MTDRDGKLTNLAMEKALGAGATTAEAFLTYSSSTTVDVCGGKTENIKVRDGSGIGVRVLVGDKLGFAHTSDLSDSGIEQTAKNAVANADSVASDPYNKLPKPAAKYRDIERFDDELAGVGVDARIERAMAIESSARAYDKRIKKVRQSTISDSSYSVYLVNSNGVALSHRGTSCTASILVVAEDNGDAQMGWDFDHSFRFGEMKVERVGTTAAMRAVELLGAKQVESMAVPVILDSPVASEFLAAVGHALQADQVQKHKSLFAGRIGENVASDKVTFIDDGAFLDGIAPAPADGEGVPSQRTPLIESGMLKGFLHNTYTAAKDNVESTANGMRSSYAGLPEVGPSNCYLVPGATTRAEIIEGCSQAFLVTDVMGMHTVNMVSGDFSVGANGLWIKNGKAESPVRETTIAGNVIDILKKIEVVADDLKFYSRYGSPTILVGGIVVSGK
jgi:PmbA protein